MNSYLKTKNCFNAVAPVNRQYHAYVIIVALLLAAPVSAADVGGAKTNGYACERIDGHLRATVNAPEDVKALVENVNAKRKKGSVRNSVSIL